MIDFACKQFDLNEIIKCGFGLTRAEYNVLEFFLKNSIDEFSTEQVSKKTHLDLTTIQKAVKKMYEKNILRRQQKNLSNGGYVFVYSIKSKKELRSLIKQIISNWNKTVEENIDRW